VRGLFSSIESCVFDRGKASEIQITKQIIREEFCYISMSRKDYDFHYKRQKISYRTVSVNY